MKKTLKKYQRIIALGCAILIAGTSMATMPSSELISAEATEEYNYAKGLQYSMYLYDANMCGTEVGENSALDWRNDCHTNDTTAIAPNGTVVDISGGYHDAGDHVKFGLPQAYSASMLGWGYYEFKDAYVQTGQSEHMETISTYFADYFKKCTILDSYGNVTAFCYQVGDGNSDHAQWCSPENQNISRPTYWATPSNPATDIVSNTVGALAFHYKNFGDEEALKYAKALYNFARNNSKRVASDGIGSFYVSDSYIDDLMWAAASLYTVTGDTSYISDANQFLNSCGDVYKFCSDWALCWGNMWPAVNLIFGRLNSGINNNAHLDWGSLNSQMMSQVEKTMSTFQNKTIIDGTYVCFDDWGSARYNTAMQLVGLVYDKYNNTNKYSSWAKSQMDYLMGNNNQGICYITGFSDNSVTNPHHRAASGLSSFPTENATINMKHTLIGGLVGGQPRNGAFQDQISKYMYTEVAIDYNAGFVGAMAGLYLKYGLGQSVDSSIEGVNGVSKSDVKVTEETSETVNSTQDIVSMETSSVTTAEDTTTSETTIPSDTYTEYSEATTSISVLNDTKVLDVNAHITTAQSNNTYHLQVSDLLESGQQLDSISFKISSYGGNIGSLITGFGISVVENSPYGSNYWYDDPYGFQTTVYDNSTVVTWTIPEGLRPYIQDSGKIMFGLWWTDCGQVRLESVTANVSSEVVITEATQDTVTDIPEVSNENADTLDDNNSDITRNKARSVEQMDTTIETTITTEYIDTSDSVDAESTTEATSNITTLDDNSMICLGDVNGDGSVKSNDLLILKKYLLGISDLVARNLQNADINSDGSVKSNDLLLLKKQLLGF